MRTVVALLIAAGVTWWVSRGQKKRDLGPPCTKCGCFGGKWKDIVRGGDHVPGRAYECGVCQTLCYITWSD